MLSPKRQKYGDLEVLELEGPGPTVILCHGYGANAEDLVPLSQLIRQPEGMRWIFPNAPLELSQIPGGRAWFEINVQALEEAMARGEHRDMSNLRSPGTDEALAGLDSCFQALSLNRSECIIAGFSQGAMLTTEYSVFHPGFAGLGILSGTAHDLNRVETQAEKMQPKVPFFQSHGTLDPILGFDYAKGLYKALTQAGLKGEFHEFPGGHEIPLPIIGKFGEFIQAHLDQNS